MKKASRWHVSIVGCLISVPVFSSDTGQISVVDIGNQPGYSAYTSGKAIAAIHQGNCSYSIMLLENQYVRFNTPDVVFLESKNVPKDKSWPYLTQAEMSAGYNWNFKKDSDLKSKWFGLMCDGAENFDLQGTGISSNPEEVSPVFQDVKEANNLKCPATLTDKGWVPNNNAGRPEEYIFQELNGANWSGFIFGFRNKKKDSITRVSFCLVRDGNVLVGAAENYSKPLLLDQKSFEEIKATLETVKFLQ